MIVIRPNTTNEILIPKTVMTPLPTNEGVIIRFTNTTSKSDLYVLASVIKNPIYYHFFFEHTIGDGDILNGIVNLPDLKYELRFYDVDTFPFPIDTPYFHIDTSIVATI